jgi:nucleoside-diphosphate-sugar epimerase
MSVHEYFPHSSLVGKRILVTGASGFIGSHLVSMANTLDVHLLGIDLVKPKKPSNIPFKILDCKNLRDLTKTFSDFNPEIVIHLAARTDLLGKRISDYADNTQASENVRKLSSGRKLIAASSRLVFDPHLPEPSDPYAYSPTTWYGESKVRMERLFLESEETVIVRPTSIWGPECGQPFRGLIANIARGTYLQAKDRNVIKTLGYVTNTVYQILRIAEETNLQSIPINLGDADIDLSLFCNELAIAMGKRKPVTVDFKILKALSLIGSGISRLGVKAPLTKSRFENIYLSQTYNLHPIHQIAPTLPVNYHESILEFARWGTKS